MRLNSSLGQVRGRSDTRRPVGQLTRPGLRLLDDVAHRAVWEACGNGHQQGALAEARDGCEIRERVVPRVPVDMRVDRGGALMEEAAACSRPVRCARPARRQCCRRHLSCSQRSRVDPGRGKAGPQASGRAGRAAPPAPAATIRTGRIGHAASAGQARGPVVRTAVKSRCRRRIIVVLPHPLGCAPNLDHRKPG